MTEPGKYRGTKRIGKIKSERKQTGKKELGVTASVGLGVGTTAVLLGDDDPSDWDNEELLHGRRRDRNGHFQGRDPNVIPREVHNELIRRSMRSADKSFRRMQSMALEQLQSIIEGVDVDDKDRLKAIELVLHRTLGKVPEKVDVAMAKAPWEDLLVDSIVDVGPPLPEPKTSPKVTTKRKRKVADGKGDK